MTITKDCPTILKSIPTQKNTPGLYLLSGFFQLSMTFQHSLPSTVVTTPPFIEIKGEKLFSIFPTKG